MTRSVFGPGVLFDRDFTGVVFREQDLQAAIVASDASLRPYTQQFLHTVVAPVDPTDATGVADVEETVELLLPLGRHGIAQVSRYLGLRPHRLQRNLADRRTRPWDTYRGDYCGDLEQPGGGYYRCSSSG